MHIPKIKEIKGNLGKNFEKILNENWKTIYENKKFHTSYFDQNKEVILRFKIKNIFEDKVLLETEKEIKHITGELAVDKKQIEIII